MTTPNEGVNEPASIDDATDLFLSQWADAEDQPSDTDKGDNAAQEDQEDEATVRPEDAENESDEDLDLEDEGDDADQSDDGDDNDNDEAPEATDDHKVTLTVDGEAKTVTVKELKRLYGQEASLTRKSQEVAQARKEAEDKGERFIVASQRLLDKAQERFKPFEGIDWLVAQQKLEPDEFAALREEARAAHMEIQFLQSEADEVLKAVREERQAEFVKQAKEAITILEKDIPGWNREVYQQVRDYAVNSGMDADVVSQITDASAIKLIHKAMRFDALKAKAAQKKSAAKANAPKRVVKPGSSKSSTLGKQTKPTDGIERLSKTGSRDDAVAAFMERWTDDSDG